MIETILWLRVKIKNLLRELKFRIRAIPYYGQGRFCPICGKSSRRFRKYGTNLRDDAECAHCGSLERHRFVWLFLKQRTDFFSNSQKKMLHIAPERCFEPRFKKQHRNGYLTADLISSQVMVKMDITNIQYPDETFDIIFCSHVLEHVSDDKKALRELNRVLKNDGWAILIVPINREKTYENPAIVEPEERLIAFGQKDHVRAYGQDYVERLRDAGFKVEITHVNDLVSERDANRMRLVASSGNIYYCTK